MKNRIFKSVFVAAIILISVFMQSCSSSTTGANEDKIKPVVTLLRVTDDNNIDNEIIGVATIQWISAEPNPSKVDIYLSVDSGVSYLGEPIAKGKNDTGEYTFDTNTVDDCRQCRIKIVARDVVGNVSDPAESSADFIINNVPQVLGAAVYYDSDHNGPDNGDLIVVPFDKDLELRTQIASDIFIVPVLGDNIGPFAKVARGVNANELVITMNDVEPFTGHLHVGKKFSLTRLHRTAPSGLNIRNNLADGILFARDTGRTAAAVLEGIDMAPGFSKLEVNTLYNEGTIRVGDLDNDGDMDLVTNDVYLNQGDWVYTDANQISANSPAIGDIDADGDQDIVSGGGWYRNNGSAVFTGPIQTGLPTAKALIDLNNDKYPDLIGADYVWLNNGAGAFVSSQPFSAGINYVVTDNNGDVSILAGLTIWKNNGQGIFVNTEQTFSGSLNFASSAMGDVDNDGDLDIVEGIDDRQPNKVWFNNANGSFSDSGQRLGEATTQSVVLFDVDEDGDLDMLEGNYGSYGFDFRVGEPIRIYLNDGRGYFTDSGQKLDTGSENTIQLLLADLDNDGDQDVIERLRSESSRFWLNSKRHMRQNYFIDSGQALGNVVPIALHDSIVLGDIDHDGDLDMVSGGYNVAAQIWKNNGEGIYSLHMKIAELGDRSVYFGDIDTDSDVDVIAGDQLWLNSGNGNFNNSTQLLANGEDVLALGDFDADEDLDVVSGNGSIWLNNYNGSGLGVFSDSVQTIGGGIIVPSDIDRDADIDLISGVRAFSAPSVTHIFRNDSDLYVDTGQNFGVDFFTNALAVGDLNGDGYPDLVQGGRYESHEVWLNNVQTNPGLGVFTLTQQILSSDYTRSIAMGDIDSDGDLDVAIASFDQFGVNTNRILMNNGNGVLTSAANQALGDSSRVFVMGDIDGDGDSDIIDGGQNRPIRVWLNDF